MIRHYSLGSFFRHACNALQIQYFPNEGVLAEYNFSEFFETTIEPISQAWLTLPDGWREKMEQRFNWLTCSPDTMLLCSANSLQLSNKTV